jgi:hypothetical protein
VRIEYICFPISPSLLLVHDLNSDSDINVYNFSDSDIIDDILFLLTILLFLLFSWRWCPVL